MTPARARKARAELEEVYTTDGDAVVIARVSASTDSAWVTGNQRHGWVALADLLTADEVRAKRMGN